MISTTNTQIPSVTVLGDAATIALKIAALVIILALLMAVADTPAYPVALGIVIVALLYVMMHGGADVLKNVVDFSSRGINQ